MFKASPRHLYPRISRYSLYRRLEGAQGRFEWMWIISPPPAFDPRTAPTTLPRPNFRRCFYLKNADWITNKETSCLKGFLKVFEIRWKQGLVRSSLYYPLRIFNLFSVRPAVNFQNLQVIGENCDLLREATKRYYRVILQTLDTGVSKWTSRPIPDEKLKKDPNFRAYLDSLEIHLMAPCEELPYLHMDEHCEYDFVAWTHVC